MFTFLMVVIAVWVLSIGSWMVLSKRVRSADVSRIKDRLVGVQKKTSKKKVDGENVALFTQEDPVKGKIVRSVLTKYKQTKRLQDLLEQAGVKWEPTRFVHACMGFFIAGYVLCWLLAPPEFRAFSLAADLVAAALPLIYLLRLKKKRMHSFEEIFPDSLEFVSRSMRAGHAFSVSLEMIHREFPEPLASEFKRTFEEHNLGLPLDAALLSLARRVPLLDVHFFVSAVMLQKRTGGNLAEILDKLAYIIRERFKLRGRIRAISAHGRMTGTALTLIPVAVAVLMFYTNPEYVKFFFTDDVGQIMLGS